MHKVSPFLGVERGGQQQHWRLEGGGEGGQGVGEEAGGAGYSVGHAQGKLACGGRSLSGLKGGRRERRESQGVGEEAGRAGYPAGHAQGNAASG